MTRLITYREADYIISSDPDAYNLPYQDTVAEHKKILLLTRSVLDEITQRVIDDYNKYKYSFRVLYPNITTTNDNGIASLLTLRNYTGFNKIGFLYEYIINLNKAVERFEQYLPEVYGFDIVYNVKCPLRNIDFTSYFAAAEAAGVEILYPLITGDNGIALVQEWHDRESPFVLWGVVPAAQELSFWDLTDGKCEHLGIVSVPVTTGYPLTSETTPFRNAYIDRWGEVPAPISAANYDAVRFILFDAIERAGTTETDAVVTALEDTDVETSMARRFAFTSDHDVMVGEAGWGNVEEDYMLLLFFQWQADGKMVPVYPSGIMEEAGATYTYPDWPGPWD